MKSTLAYVLLLTVVFFTSCKQGQTNTPGNHIGLQAKAVSTPYGPNTMVRNIKKGRNGTVLIAASLGGVFRYDGKLFTSLTSQLGSLDFGMFWKTKKEIFGFLLPIQVFTVTMGNPFNILQPAKDLQVM